MTVFFLRFLSVLILIFSLLTQQGVLPAAAATYVVNSLEDNTTDDSFCTLREAILAANNTPANSDCGAGSPADDTITFSVRGTIALNSPLTNIVGGKGALTIDGGGPQQGGQVTLSGANQHRLIFLYNAKLTIHNLTLINGKSVEGGAIRSSGYDAEVYIYNSVFRNHDSTAGVDEEGGGAISMHFGKLHIEDSLFEGNRGINGGAIYNLRCPITVLRSTFRNNDSSYGGVVANFGFGGAIYNDGAGPAGTGGEIVIRDSVFIGNRARNFGGAVYSYLYYPDRSTIERSVFSDNIVYRNANQRASGGALMHHNGPLILSNSTFINNRSENAGGAILIAQTTFPSGHPEWNQTALTNLTIVGNRADHPAALEGSGGGLYFQGGKVTVTNVTVAYNYADKYGGGIYNTSSNSADVDLRNVIIAHNNLGWTHNSAECQGLLRGSHNLQSLSGNACVEGILRAEPSLESNVADHGGGVPTLALLPHSPAIDAGSNLVCPPTDQRGVSRPLDGNGDGLAVCDIGSYEKDSAMLYLPLMVR